MISGIGEAAMGAMAQERKLDTISNNLANANTVGFRKDVLTFKGILTSAIAGEDSTGFSSLVPQEDMVAFDTTEGDYQQTGRTFDLAIEGKGFFKVRDSNGKFYYTRAGNFSLNQIGRLTTADGKYEVLNSSNTSINLDIANAKSISVDGNGEIYVNGERATNIGIADFNDYSGIAKLGGALFSAGDEVAKPVAAPSIKSGFLENSSVNSIVEMGQMIEAMRNMEANMQVIRFQDSTLDKAVNDLGRLT